MRLGLGREALDHMASISSRALAEMGLAPMVVEGSRLQGAEGADLPGPPPHLHDEASPAAASVDQPGAGQSGHSRPGEAAAADHDSVPAGATAGPTQRRHQVDEESTTAVLPHPKRRRTEARDEAAATGASSAWIQGAEWGRGHAVRVNGNVAFCTKCGAYAIQRVGSALATVCAGPSADTKLKVERMRRGLHPVTGLPAV